MPFADRREAGRLLASRLDHVRGEQPVVVGVARGGVPVAAEVARVIGAPLDVIVVRKLGLPGQPEFAMGAIGEDGVRVVDSHILEVTGVTPAELAAVEAHERLVLAERVHHLRDGRPRIPLRGRSVIVVDDGIATGATAKAACRIARAEGARRVVLAVPVAPPDWVTRMDDVADEFVAFAEPPGFAAVGQFYDDFSPTREADVIDALDSASTRNAGTVDEDVELPVDGTTLHGRLAVPPDATGIVVFVHGSGSSRHSPRNRFVADILVDAGLATLLFDLLTDDEAADRSYVFDIDLLADRLVTVSRWVERQVPLHGLPMGYFGASTGAAAALAAAATFGDRIAAVVSRGGRPDLAMPILPAVLTPTLLIVGGHDTTVLELNRRALSELRCEARLEIVEGATHLFEEPGTLSMAATLARDWFVDHLSRETRSS